MRTKLLLLGLCCFLVFVSAQQSYAAIYKYVDKNGVICFANDLQSIPEQFRGSAQVVSDNPEPENPQSIHNQSPEQPTGIHGNFPSVANDTAVDARSENSFFNNRLFLTAIIVVTAAFAFIILGIIETDRKRTIAVVRVILLWAVALYLLIAHAGDALHVIRAASGKVDDVKHQSEEKGKKAGKAIKAWGEFVEQVGQTSSPDIPETVQEKKE